VHCGEEKKLYIDKRGKDSLPTPLMVTTELYRMLLMLLIELLDVWPARLPENELDLPVEERDPDCLLVLVVELRTRV